ncbi:MAG: hypothetical protein AB7Y74_07805 [Syntrophorhabdus sp.]
MYRSLALPPAQGMLIMVDQLATPTLLLHTITPLQPMGIVILITDRDTIHTTDTVGIMDPDIMVTIDIGGKKKLKEPRGNLKIGSH